MAQAGASKRDFIVRKSHESTTRRIIWDRPHYIIMRTNHIRYFWRSFLNDGVRGGGQGTSIELQFYEYTQSCWFMEPATLSDYYGCDCDSTIVGFLCCVHWEPFPCCLYLFCLLWFCVYNVCLRYAHWIFKWQPSEYADRNRHEKAWSRGGLLMKNVMKLEKWWIYNNKNHHESQTFSSTTRSIYVPSITRANHIIITIIYNILSTSTKLCKL